MFSIGSYKKEPTLLDDITNFFVYSSLSRILIRSRRSLLAVVGLCLFVFLSSEG